MQKILTAIGLALACLHAHAKLDLNPAREMDLDGLKGVGPALSQSQSEQGARIEGKAWVQAK